MSGRHKEKGNKMKEPKFLDSSGWHVSLVLPYMVTARGARGRWVSGAAREARLRALRLRAGDGVGAEFAVAGAQW